MSNWVKNSAQYFLLWFPENDRYVLYFGIAVGCVILGHSAILHKTKWRMVRVMNDIAAVSLILQMTVFLDCYWHTCSMTEQIIMNALGNGLFSAAIQISDNYLTYSRYAVVVRGISKKKQVVLFWWSFFFLYMTWWCDYIVFPFFFDLNNSFWFSVLITLQYIWTASYVLYDFVFLCLLCQFLITAKRQAETLASTDNIYIVFAVRAICHTLVSLAGVFCCLNLPVGMAEQTILTSISIHCFLNWSIPTKLLRKKLAFFKRSKIASGEVQQTKKPSLHKKRSTRNVILVSPSIRNET